MTNEYYEPGELRTARVKDLFTRIATRYDLINDLQSFGLHRRWKRRVMSLARPDHNDTALDLCCGTGDLALLLASRCARVVALDFTERMLEVALKRVDAMGSATGVAHPKQCVPQYVQGD